MALIQYAWQTQFFFGLLACVIWLTFREGRKLGLIFSVAWCYTCVSALLFVVFPVPIYNGLYLNFAHSCSKALLAALLIPYICLNLSKRQALKTLRLLDWFVIVDSLMIIFIGNDLFNNMSMGASLIAALFPMFLFRCKRQGKLFPLIQLVAIFMSGSDSALFVLAFTLFVYLFKESKSKLAIIIPTLIIGIGALIRGRHLVSTNGRTIIWEQIMTWWLDNASHFIGIGFGTFEVAGQAIQNKKIDVFFWLHNEYLQVLFELGIIGFVLYGMVFIMMLRKIATTWLLATWCGLMLVFSVQFPFHFFISEFFIFLLFVVTLRGWFGDARSTDD